MNTEIKICVELQKHLYQQAESLAQQLKLSPEALMVKALADFIAQAEAGEGPGLELKRSRGRALQQGELYWARVEKPGEPESGLAHPHVVIQDDLFNQSRLDTVLLCALTSNLKRAQEPGNVLLDAGEANLPKASVVVVSQISTLRQSELGDYIGCLAPTRLAQIFAGMRFQQRAFFRPD